MKSIPLIARVLIALIILMAGIAKLQDPTGTVQYMVAYGLPLARIGLWVAIVLEILGALAIMTGFKAKYASMVLIPYLLVVTLVFHTAFSDQMQVTAFLKNLSVIGGLLMIVYYGAGPMSLGGKKPSSSKVNPPTDKAPVSK